MSIYSPIKFALLAITVVVAACARIDDPIVAAGYGSVQTESSPRETRANPNRNLYWGDLHIHTSLSYDAYVMGVRVMPDDAYAFAKGESIEHALGYPIQLSRPLDFAAVTDHAEYLGLARHLEINGGEKDRLWAELHRAGGALQYTWHYLGTLIRKMADREKRERELGKQEYEPVSRAAWRQVIDSAQRNNKPGHFTSFIGYEWSSIPIGENLHRNIIYAGDGHPDTPYSSRESNNPMDLWAELDRQRRAGMDMIAIPHNGNSSNGRMYARLNFTGAEFTEEYAIQRMRNEPLSEIYQVKGASETHPTLSPEDEFAGFELYDQQLNARGGISNPRGSYARDALRTGLEFKHSRGFNPFRFGVIGSSDSHNGSSASEEDRHHGKLPMLDGSPSIRMRMRLLVPEFVARGSRWSSQGLVAVWAVENTRAALFSAMRKKETYATSGTRIGVRFFGSWNYPEGLMERQDREAIAYASGVPMGGKLPAMRGVATPQFAIWAQKDPMGANLDRIQIVKAWVDMVGSSHEKVFDVAWSSPERRKMENGVLLPVGNTVNVSDATYTNDIGAEALSALWRDPEFNPEQEAFYYARVLEIPTPRWSTYDAVVLGLTPPEPASIQERAVTSAIWYESSPAAANKQDYTGEE